MESRSHWTAALVALMAAAVASIGCSSMLIDPMQHELQVGNETTFVSKVKVARQTTSTAAFFYTPSDSDIKRLIDKEIDVVSRELKGIFTIVAMDCSSRSLRSICEAELGAGYSTPVLRVYPKLPMPAYNYSGNMVSAMIKRELVKHVASLVEVIKPGKLPEFMGKFETMPKALLFSDKAGPNYVYKALSLVMDKKLLLGFVNVGENPELKARYKVKSLPDLIVVKPDSKVDRFEGTFDYSSMFEWLNVYSETFLLGSGYEATTPKAAKSKAWKHDPLPQLTLESHMDICFNKSHGFCVIYLTNGELGADDRQMLMELSARYKGEFTGKWMWMNLASEPEFAKLFGEPADLPSVAIFNPKKKLRFMLFEGDGAVTREGIENMLEKILGGDARFKLVRGDKLPAFSPVVASQHDEL
ncbi:signal peptide-containing protein [Babesia ovata]|uniref:Signal peptide-containing protein n=1 Tax=Babesia ovata TaxID=189622 RepID=A0A2H6K7M8_9APIC|nr:signal peptide-containing protein [Babesia ovata]GBE58995.1 signal peptide-containing protein [Babesia ovata]